MRHSGGNRGGRRDGRGRGPGPWRKRRPEAAEATGITARAAEAHGGGPGTGTYVRVPPHRPRSRRFPGTPEHSLTSFRPVLLGCSSEAMTPAGSAPRQPPATSHGLEARLKSPDSTRSEPFQEPTASRAASPLPSRAAGCSQVETAKTLPAPGDGAGLRATCPDRSMGARAGPASRRPAACRTVRAGGPMPRLGGPEPEPPTPPCRRWPLTPACEDRRAPRLARPLPTGPETAARTLNDQAETRSSGRGTRNGSA